VLKKGVKSVRLSGARVGSMWYAKTLGTSKSKDEIQIKNQRLKIKNTNKKILKMKNKRPNTQT
jgi:hypothetical protein